MSPSPSSSSAHSCTQTTHSTSRPHTAPVCVCVLSYWMQEHEVIDEVLLNECGDRPSMSFYTLPPLSQTPMSAKSCHVLTGQTVLWAFEFFTFIYLSWCRNLVKREEGVAQKVAWLVPKSDRLTGHTNISANISVSETHHICVCQQILNCNTEIPN